MQSFIHHTCMWGTLSLRCSRICCWQLLSKCPQASFKGIPPGTGRLAVYRVTFAEAPLWLQGQCLLTNQPPSNTRTDSYW